MVALVLVMDGCRQRCQDNYPVKAGRYTITN